MEVDVDCHRRTVNDDDDDDDSGVGRLVGNDSGNQGARQDKETPD